MSELNFAKRIEFHKDLQIMEADFLDVTFATSETVNAFYDELDKQLAETGQKWFFLVNYKNCRIMSEAWITFAHRGKLANIAHSLGSARFATSEDTSDAILDSSQREKFDPNIFRSREGALAHIKAMRDEIPEADWEARLVPTPMSTGKPPAERIAFHKDLNIMEVDYSDYTFATSKAVNEFYDEITKQVTNSGQKWYFLVNYGGTEILPDAWYTWTARGKKLNADHSLGTVRFDPKDVASQDIMKRARADEFNPNLVATRDEALGRINELKSQGSASA